MTTELNDFDGLLNWPNLQEWIAGNTAVPGDGPVTAVEPITGGSQNNIFRLHRGATELVLRRPPTHPRPNSNDTMLREARVLGAIKGSNVPHPEFYAVCADTEVIGTTFYVMAPIVGFTPMGELPGQYATDVEGRRRLAFELVEGAAKLGAIDPNKVGLADFGKSEDWIGRQVSRWRSQLDGYSKFENYGSPDFPGIDGIGEWLEANKPAEAKIGIIHGDYQFANVMFSYHEPKLAAAIDWELSSLGDPLLDLAWVLTSWIEPGDPPGKAPQLQPWEGMPSRAELIAHYGEFSGRDMSDMPWFLVLACYKLGILLEGTHARACAGQAPKAMGDILHDYAAWLFALAKQTTDAN
jgi:aminoglycoside phosphotransferase (APT) family kinase protein